MKAADELAGKGVNIRPGLLFIKVIVKTHII
jgi:hypothetical protein